MVRNHGKTGRGGFRKRGKLAPKKDVYTLFATRTVSSSSSMGVRLATMKSKAVFGKKNFGGGETRVLSRQKDANRAVFEGKKISKKGNLSR